MKKIATAVAAALAFAAVPFSALATPVLDQNNPTLVGGFCYMNTGNLCGQSFEQSAATLAGAGIYLDANYGVPNGALTISIFSSYSSSPSGLIASGTTSYSTASSGWLDVMFATAVALTPGQLYYMVLGSTTSVVADYSAANYANGNALYGGNATAYASIDLMFRTYSDTASASNVPEPASVTLLAAGLLGLGLLRKKKN